MCICTSVCVFVWVCVKPTLRNKPLLCGVCNPDCCVHCKISCWVASRFKKRCTSSSAAQQQVGGGVHMNHAPKKHQSSHHHPNLIRLIMLRSITNCAFLKKNMRTLASQTEVLMRSSEYLGSSFSQCLWRFDQPKILPEKPANVQQKCCTERKARQGLEEAMTSLADLVLQLEETQRSTMVPFSSTFLDRTYLKGRWSWISCHVIDVCMNWYVSYCIIMFKNQKVQVSKVTESVGMYWRECSCSEQAGFLVLHWHTGLWCRGVLFWWW